MSVSLKMEKSPDSSEIDVNRGASSNPSLESSEVDEDTGGGSRRRSRLDGYEQTTQWYLGANKATAGTKALSLKTPPRQKNTLSLFFAMERRKFSEPKKKSGRIFQYNMDYFFVIVTRPGQVIFPSPCPLPSGT